eukprot:g3293.t1
MWLLKKNKKLDASKQAHDDRKTSDFKRGINADKSRRGVIATKSYALDGEVRQGSPMEAAERDEIEKVLKKHFLFESIKEEGLNSLCKGMIKSAKKSGEEIIKQGAEGDSFFVLTTGSVTVNVDGKDVAKLPAPCAFGELALMHNQPRNATITCASECTVWDIDQRTFRKVLASHATTATAKRVKFLKTVDHLSSLSSLELTKVANALQIVDFKAGETIIRQGQHGENFFIIESGTVEVSAKKKGSSSDVVVATLSSGKYFGEAALLKKEPRNATCTAKNDVTLARLSHDQFNHLLGPLSDLLGKSAETRAAENAATLEKTRTRSPSRPMGPMIKKDLSELKVDRIIGQGTFGRVKLVTHLGMNKVMVMKCMSKAQIVQQKQVKNVMNEKNSLAAMDHPFVVRQYGTWQDPDQIYIFLEIVQGGELWSLIYQSRKLKRTAFGGFEENVARMYACTVISALTYIHAQGYVYRDLKPENLMIDKKGYLKVVDFGFAKKLAPGEKSHTLCGTPEYLAPELVCARGHDKGADYWAFGILCYELLVEVTPFADPDQQKMFEKISRSARVLMFPRGFPRSAKDLITKLLNANAALRLGCGHEGGEAIKKHRWFTGIDWKLLERRRYRSPYQPTITSSTDVGNFDKFEEEQVRPYRGPQNIFAAF